VRQMSEIANDAERVTVGVTNKVKLAFLPIMQFSTILTISASYG